VDDPDDRPERGAPLPPEDRLWRHPSEIAAAMAAASGAAAPAPRSSGRRRRVLVAVSVLSGVTGAAVTVVALAALGTFSPRVVERVERASATRPTATPTTAATALVAASSVAPAVVEVASGSGTGRREGSGVVVRSDGVILTSSRLVAGHDAVLVTWPSGRSLDAEVAGHDGSTGLAVLLVDGRGFPAVEPAPSGSTPGEAAITVAAGTDGRGPSLAQGVVSATNAHADTDDGWLLGLIETDRPVPEWGDGAALVDARGGVQGVCLQVSADDVTGWAVPIDVALQVADDIADTGEVTRGWLGVRGTATDADGTVPAGVALTEVAAGSPAADAGLEVDDVVIAVDEDRVRSMADVQASLLLARPGQEVRVERLREGATATVSVVLADAPG
jgi:putative serine protease PepD